MTELDDLQNDYLKITKTRTELLQIKERIISNDLEKAPKVFDLSEHGLRDPEFRLIAPALEINNTIQHLDLSHNLLGAESMSMLAEILKKNKNITSINLSNNYFHSNAILFLANALVDNSSIKSINLSHNPIYDNSIEWIKPLIYNKKLEFLDISHTKIGDRAMMSFTEVFVIHPCLKEIKLHHNEISVEGAKALTKGLLNSKYITELDLSNNLLKDEGLVYITKGLRKNKYIKKLNLSNNMIINKGFYWLSKLIKNNSNLKELNIENNELNDEGIIALSKNIENSGISNLQYTINPDWSSEGKRAHNYIQKVLAKKDDFKNFCKNIKSLIAELLLLTDSEEIEITIERLFAISKQAKQCGHDKAYHFLHQELVFNNITLNNYTQAKLNDAIANKRAKNLNNQNNENSFSILLNELLSMQERIMSLENDIDGIWSAISKIHDVLENYGKFLRNSNPNKQQNTRPRHAKTALPSNKTQLIDSPEGGKLRFHNKNQNIKDLAEELLNKSSKKLVS